MEPVDGVVTEVAGARILALRVILVLHVGPSEVDIIPSST